MDMSEYILAKSSQLNADDLMDSPKTITITKVSARADSAEQPVSVSYEGDNGQPFLPCKTVRRIMVAMWGKNASEYAGRSMTLYRDPAVAFGGMQVGGIRVSHMSHIDGEKTVALMVTRGRKAPFKVLPLAVKAQPADDQAVALKAITDAAEEGLDALGNVWKQKWMAPHRDALQVDLDRLKVVAEAKGKPAATAPEPATEAEVSNQNATDEAPKAGESDAGPTPDDHPAKATADKIIAELEKPETNAELDVNSILARCAGDLTFMPEDQQIRVEIAADKRRNAIREAQEKAKAGETAGAE